MLSPIRLSSGDKRLSQVEQIHSDLAQARALHRLGRHTEGLELARAAAASSEALAFAPVFAEAMLERGQLEAAAEQPQAAETLRQAFVAAETGRDDRLRARIILEQLAFAQTRRDPALADPLREHADALVQRAGSDPELEVRLASLSADIEHNRGRFDLALAQSELALRTSETLWGTAD